VHADHNIIAGVDAGSAVYTLQLGAVADIDTGGAYPYARKAVDTITLWRGDGSKFFYEVITGSGTLTVGAFTIMFFFFISFAVFAPWLTTLIIIGYQNGVLVQQYALQSAIGANNNTHLLPEPPVHKEKNAGEYQ